ncbi:DNA-binding CsgD family transcriptional regulator [Actinoplanes octamycinicus]|uniref:DNA-binding CsgD family transcriptional regulator n=1 Tax=Actinoplanes octamycinicus TaxID=135948 RepID=A0A7W7M8H7_9ACTN|nr:LuxR family transcriptional regulator [Actinoplanes octamycinicus]MBB4740943.1 DNA-binding CsgD family transcriptional regulator [Actinoplanes octamycinicus]
MQEVERLLHSAAAGQGGALVLCGAPGSGRSTLLRAALRHAAGWTVHTVPGHAAERSFPCAALRRLTDRITWPAARDDEAVVTAGDSLLDFLRTTAAGRPLLCLLDDAHLLDAPSREVIGYAARRVGGHRIAVLAAGPPSLADLDLPARHLRPLTPPECRTLLAEHAPDLAADVALTLADLSGGNPAALVDLARSLSPEQRRGYTPLPTELHPDSPLRRRLHTELAALPPATRRLLLLAAATPPAPLPDLLAAADAGLADFRPAERAGLVTVDGDAVHFGSEVARGVAYREMSSVGRRTAHLALAGVAAAHGRRLDALLHRAAASTTADPALAAQLTEAAATAAPAEATEAFRYAAQLSTDPTVRDAALVDAARTAWLAGRPHRAGLLLRQVTVARTRVRARGLAAEMRPDGPASREILMDVAADLAQSDPVAALDALSLAGEAAGLAGEQGRYAALARRVAAGRRGDEAAAVTMAYHHVAGLADIACRDEEAAFARFRQELELAGAVREPIPLIRAATAAILVGDARMATASAGRAVVLAGADGAHSLVPRALELAALAGMASGDYDAATAAALDGVATARGTGQSALAGTHLGLLAVLAAMVGDRDSGQARIRAATGTEQARPLCEWALAVLDLVDGQRRAAAERLHLVVAGPPGRGSVLLRVAVVPHLLEAAGPEPALNPVAAAFDDWAGRTGQDGWLALRDRCRALRTRDGEAAEAHFHAALRRVGEAGFPRAHTELLYGRLLRRRRRHVAAREHLRRAAETFRLLGAEPWAAQSIRELRAAGERSAPRAAAGRSGPQPLDGAGLTAQQERIAALVAEGATNREVAQELHLSPRTVDHHLRNVFARLGVRSRTEMAHLLAAR